MDPSIKYLRSTGLRKPNSRWCHKTKCTVIGVIMGLFLAGCGGTDGGSANTVSTPLQTPPGLPSSDLSTVDERDVALDATQAPTMTTTTDGNNVTAMCTAQPWVSSSNRELSDIVVMDSSSALYPGAVLEGASFQAGDLVTVKVPRAPGNIYLEGLLLDPGSRYAAENIEMSATNLNQTIAGLLTDSGVQGTAANFEFVSSQTYSLEEMFFRLGIDGRFGNKSINADLEIDTSSERHYTVVNFTQVYYDVFFDDSTLTQPTSVFLDGDNFVDTRDQINDNSPPLYVSKVSYGRTVTFVAESTHDATEVAVALEAALKKGPATATLSSGLTHQQVLERTKIRYHVRGGSAGLALEPLDAVASGDIFAKVSSFIADPEVANFSASSPGLPVAYSVKYLKDSRPAQMGFEVQYNKKDCEFTHPAPTVQSKPTYYLRVSNVTDGKLKVFVNGVQCGGETRTSKRYDIYKCLDDNHVNDVRVDFNTNFGCHKTNVSWYIDSPGYTHTGSEGGHILWPTRANGIHVTSAQIRNELKCDDFYWTTTVDTRQTDPMKAFGGYSFSG